VTYAQAKRWLASVEGLDTCTLRPLQVIYTAAPVFRDGLEDPIPRRLGVLEGAAERVAVPDLPNPAPASRAHVQERAAASTGWCPTHSAEGLGLQASVSLDAALEKLAEMGSAVPRGVLRELARPGLLPRESDMAGETAARAVGPGAPGARPLAAGGAAAAAGRAEPAQQDQVAVAA
jgi:hypothetical protein